MWAASRWYERRIAPGSDLDRVDGRAELADVAFGRSPRCQGPDHQARGVDVQKRDLLNLAGTTADNHSLNSVAASRTRSTSPERQSTGSGQCRRGRRSTDHRASRDPRVRP